MCLKDEIKNALRYDPDTGHLYWKVSVPGRRAGSQAGCLDKKGYVSIGFKGKVYTGARLAWLLHTGKWPAAPIVDHWNLVKNDNRWVNLREATARQNAANRRPSPRGLPKGAVAHPCGKFQAQIRDSGKCRYLGLFETPEQAGAAYAKAAAEVHGEFARVE